MISLPLQSEATQLISFQEDGENFQATPETYIAWKKMKDAATQDGIILVLVSAFRSIDRQQELVDAKRKEGVPDSEIFKILARPGFSEHHTGRALDLHTPNSALLEESFETTLAFEWMQENGHFYGFQLSYPRNNPYGITYEPWHWYLNPTQSVQ